MLVPMRSPASAAALLVLVVAAGAVLRLAGLPDQSLWIDEVYTLADIDRPLGDIVPRLRAEESTPPVYFWMVWGWTHVFDGDLGLRSLSLLCGLAAIPVAFALGAGLAGPWSGLAAAALIAVNRSWFGTARRGVPTLC
jgi:mannosyltransferase